MATSTELTPLRPEESWRMHPSKFSVVKAVATTRVAMKRELFWFPYRPQQYQLLRRMTKAAFGLKFGR